VNKDTIVQFVCFTSPLEPAGFMEMWEPYAKLLVNDPSKILLQEGVADKDRTLFSYVSQHVSNATDFKFAFMKGKTKSHFPEQKARIKQAGGYLPVQLQTSYNKAKDDVKVMAFVAHGETDLDFYRTQTFRHLNIYEAYFENCAYSYVMEYFLQKLEAPALLARLKARHGVEAAVYKECRVAHSSRKVSGSLL
jgi:hypothetical protein